MSRMKAPKSGVRVRMYRQGQGDCFLLAFPRDGGRADDPVYLLIDCGYMFGSQFRDTRRNRKIEMDEIIDHIADATGGAIDYVAVTHEHADHVNGFNKKRDGARVFDKIKFGHLFLAWTEDGDDDFANDLRERFKDQLITLALAEEKMGALGVNGDAKAQLSHLLDLELGSEADRLSFTKQVRKDGPLGFDGTFGVKGKTNKEAIAYLRNQAKSGPEFLRPDQPAFALDGASGAKVYVLGPPRDVDLLVSLEPQGKEEFHARPGFGLSGEMAAFHMAVTGEADQDSTSPFAKRYTALQAEVEAQQVVAPDPDYVVDPVTQVSEYNARYYYEAEKPRPEQDWRRIDGDWLRTTNALALRLNHEVNNTSLVLAFELPGTGKVLLFSGDAQRGNWISWKNLTWGKGDEKLTAKELLGRVVFYKCGHHGSHNATLDGTGDSDYPNLGWFAQGTYAKDFVAMIPVHSDWAMQANSWNHPLPSIEDALRKKARGRVLRNDRDRVKQPAADADHTKLTEDEWDAFKKQSIEARLYKEYVVLDE